MLREIDSRTAVCIIKNGSEIANGSAISIGGLKQTYLFQGKMSVPCAFVFQRYGGVLPPDFTNNANSQQNTCPRTAQNTNMTSPLPVSTISAYRSPNLYYVKLWFNGNGLSWYTPIETYLFCLWVGCVEHLKMLEPIEIRAMFQHHPPITHRVERRVFKHLNSSGKCNPNKCT